MPTQAPAEHALEQEIEQLRARIATLEAERARDSLNEQALRKQAQLPEENPNPVLRVMIDGALDYANAGAKAWLADMGSAAGQPVPAALRALVDRAGREQRVIEEEFEAEGGGRTLCFSAFQPPGAAYVNLFGRDVTERRNAARALAESEKIYRAIGESIDYGIWICAPDGRNTYASESFLKLVGQTQKQCADFGWGDVLHPADAEGTIAAWKECVRAEGRWNIEHRYRGADGKWHPILSRGVPVRDEQGRIVCWAGINLDISDLKQAEESLRESRSREANRAAELETILDTAPVAVFIARDPECRYMRGNRMTYELLRLPPGSNVSKSASGGQPGFRAMRNGTEIPAHELPVQKAAATGKAVRNQEFELVYEDGTRRALMGHAAPLLDGDGRPRGAVGIFVDITERKQAEEKLFDTHQRLQSLMEALPVGVSFSDDPTCERITGNPAVLAQFEVGPEDNLSATAPDASAPGRQVHFFAEGREIAGMALPLQRAVKYGRVVPPVELEVRLPSGRVWFATATAAPFHDRQGNVAGGVAVTVDITERKQSEERLRHSQKLESIGVLAGGIAHDFNNLLTAILGNASLLEVDASPERAARLRAILEASEKAASLTRQLLAYAGKGQFQVTDFDVTRMVRSLADLIRVSIPKCVALDLQVPKNLPAVRGDSAQIQQVLMNLVINAAEATGNLAEGRVSVSVETANLTAAAAGWIGSGIIPGQYIVITVRDNGCGMDEQTSQRIFDPFFTTKFTGRGLGLAAVQGILRSHRGAITVHSRPGQGSTFTVYLPASQANAAPSGRTNCMSAGGQSATVLVVDDEESVRAFSKVAIERLGHRVLLARDGRQALELLTDNPDIDLVVLDIVMPVLGGVEALSEIRRKRPQLRVLAASGYSQYEGRRLGIPEDVPFLEKPYTVQVLADAVETALRGRPSRPGG